MFRLNGQVSGMLAVTIATSLGSTGLESQKVNAAPQKADAFELPAGSEPDKLYIRFDDGVDPDAAMALFTDKNASNHLSELNGATWSRATGRLKRSEVALLHGKAQKTTGKSLPDPWQGLYVKLAGGMDAAVAMNRLQDTGMVNKVLPVPVSVSPYFPSPDQQPNQGYLLTSADNGIGAEEVWNRFGITGEGVRVCDIEYEFDDQHCDLPPVNALGPFFLPGNGRDHGTASIGCVAALNDGLGTTGIAHGVDEVLFAPGREIVQTDQGPVTRYIDSAILEATMNMEAGDVLLIEQAIYGPNAGENPANQRGSVPVEWFEPYYDAIVLAVANGIIVIEPAGNGYENLDDAIYSQGNGGHWPFLLQNDSGAIMVGGGRSGQSWGVSRSRHSWSNYGATVDVQGWGDSIMTTGYGWAHNEANCDYTDRYSGTSGASAILAGTTALLQSYYKNRWNGTLSPADMKWILQNTGVPQRDGQNPAAENIGPLPDLVAATDFLESLTPLHRVPEQHATIQDAIDAAGNGDTILVGPGLWKSFEVDKKNLLIQSTHGKDSTYIDGFGDMRCILCLDSDVQIEGFTIQNCRADDGAGIYAAGEELTVKSCLFRNNFVTTSGGGVWSNCDKTTIEDCTFQENRAWFAGAGLHTLGEEANVSDCVFEQNNADNGGGFNIRTASSMIRNCMFMHNEARFTGGGLDLWHGEHVVQSCYFEGNNSNKGGGVSVAQTASATFTSCEFFWNTADILGAGAWLENAPARFELCRFMKNVAFDAGGAIKSSQDSNPEIISSVLCGNMPQHIHGLYQDLGDNCLAEHCDDANLDGILDECEVVQGDVNGDGNVAVDDILAVIAAFGACAGCDEDVNGDGVVNVNDLLFIINCWNGEC